MKISESTKSTTQLGQGVVGVGGDSRAIHDANKLKRSEISDGKVDGGEVDNEVGKKGQKTFKSKNLFKSKKLSKSKKSLGSDFITPRTKLAFTELRQTFFKAPILYHFNPERHICIKIDVSGHAIDRVLSQLTSDNLSR